MRELIIMTIIAFVTAAFAERRPSRRLGGLGYPKPNIIAFILPAIMFTVYSGLRQRCGDTYYYIHSYELLQEGMDMPKFTFRGNQMFEILQWLCRRVTDDAQLFIFICAVISLVPVIYILYKYSYPFDLSIFLFVTMGYFSLSMNGMRQYVAAGILVLGTKYFLSERKGAWYKFILIALIAYLFHSSAIIMIPLFFITRRKAWTPLTFIILTASVFFFMMFQDLLPSFLGFIEDSTYDRYVENKWFTSGQEGGSSIERVFVMAVPVVLSYMARHRLALLGRKGDILVNLAVVNFAISIISLNNWIFTRFSIYLGTYLIILIAWVVTQGFNNKSARYFYIMCIALYCFYFYELRYSIQDYWSPYFS
ncbi:MAG: EpsG family protein [Clostridiales bacterium]|nr:EpsG family protein [Clostridiales bacterium]